MKETLKVHDIKSVVQVEWAAAKESDFPDVTSYV